MAAISTTEPESRYRSGFTKNIKRFNHKIDMTPMVDLGFLLITFFIFTATMSAPNTMNLYMPAPGPPSFIGESGALNIIVGKDDEAYYYEGKLLADGSNILKTPVAGIRAEIMKKKNAVIANYIPDPACEAKAVSDKKPIDNCKQQKLMVLIKPTANANYKTIVKIIDEMAINKIARYALIEPDKEELQFIK